MTPQTPQQQANAFQGAGLNTGQQAAVSAGVHYNGPTTYTPPTTITSAHLAPQSPIQLPPPPNPTNPMPMNASVPSPIPSAASIVGQEGQTTPGEQQQSSILNNIAQLMGGNTSLATLQTTQENGAGVPALTKSVNDLNTQLKGLNDSASLLQLNAAPGSTIDNNKVESSKTSDVFQATAHATDDLRNNQIQQAAVAAQSLTVKSALYGAQGNLTLAKDAADKAAQVQYDAQQQAIDHQKAQLDAIQPTLTKQQKVQADTVQAQLQDRQNQIAQAKTDMATGIAMATAAIKNNPNDAQAQYAAQQALQAAQQQPPDLQKIFGLVGKYQTDPIATQTAIQQLQNARLTGQKTALDIQTARQSLGSSTGTGQVVGTTGSPTINTTAPGYNSTPVAGGLSQSAIDQAALQYALTGKMPSIGLGGTGAAGAKKTAIQNRAAELNSGGNIAANSAQLKSLNSSLTQQTEYLNTIQRSVSNAEAGLNQVLGAFNGKVNASSYPTVNAAVNAAKSQLSPGDISAYQAGLTEVANEYTQVFSRGGTATDAVRNRAASIANGNLSLPDLQKVFNEVQSQGNIVIQGSQNQVKTIQDQINGIIGGTKNSSGTTNQTKSGQAFDVAGAKAAGYTDAQIQAYLAAN